MILFTTDDTVLSLVADNDPLYQAEVKAIRYSSSYNEEAELEESCDRRPKTADHSEEEERPFTTTRMAVDNQQSDQAVLCGSEEEEGMGCLPELEAMSSQPLVGSVIELSLAKSWGDTSYTGLTGFELLTSPTQQPLSLRAEQLSGTVMEGLPSLVGRVNLTTDVENMYLCPVCLDCPTISIALDTPTRLHGMRVWNYNASVEDSYRGVSCTNSHSTVTMYSSLY